MKVIGNNYIPKIAIFANELAAVKKPEELRQQELAEINTIVDVEA